MFISVPRRDCRTACEAALKTHFTKQQEDREKLGNQAYQSIYDGAVHNGLKPTIDDLQKMRDMASRDVEHMMENHATVELIECINVYIRMLDYSQDTEVVLDAGSFSIIGQHLPEQAERAA